MKYRSGNTLYKTIYSYILKLNTGCSYQFKLFRSIYDKKSIQFFVQSTCDKYNQYTTSTHITSRAGTAYPSGSHEFHYVLVVFVLLNL
jgi:hypothetical protein